MRGRSTDLGSRLCAKTRSRLPGCRNGGSLMTDDLRSIFRAALDPPALALMDEVEQFSGKVVGIVLEPPRTGTPNPLAMRTHLDSQGATITIRSTEQISSHDAFHELLHIKRYWIDGIPRLVGASYLAEVPQQLHTTLEHVAMAGSERLAGYDPVSYWTRTNEVNWSKKSPLSHTNPENLRFYTVLNYLFRDAVTPDFRNYIRKKIRKAGLSDAISLVDGLLPRLDADRRGVIKEILAFCGTSRTGFYLVYYDIRSGVDRKEAL